MLNRIVLESLEQSRNLLLEQQIDIAKRLREIQNLMPRKRIADDYTVFKQKRKKGGFVYCVRYYENGKVKPTKYSLGTTDLEEAKRKAVEMREDFLGSYGKKERRGNSFYNLLSGYYADGSKLLAESIATKRNIAKKQIKTYHSFINKYFIPYLKKEGIKKAEDLKPAKILEFAGWLRETGQLKTAKTINDRISGAIKKAFDFLYLKEKITYNPFRNIAKGDITLIAKDGEVKRRRIFPINRLFDVLSYPQLWILSKSLKDLENPNRPEKQYKLRKYLLCLIAATTGLREGEIFMLKKSSIEKIGGIYFLNIENSRIDPDNPGVKTPNAYRRVPLHKFVYNAINEYIEKMNITGDYLFKTDKRKTQNGTIFIEAYKQCGIHCGYTEIETKNNNVDFHSFRHFYRTILSQDGVSKQLARYFMGQAKDMSNMDERYDNIEEIGNDIGDIDLLIENAKKVITILDKHFNNSIQRHIGESGSQSVLVDSKEIELTNPKNSKIKYWTWVICGYESIIDYEGEDNLK